MSCLGVAIWLVVAACGSPRDNKPGEPVAAREPEGSRGAENRQITPPPDLSLTPREYVQLGLPPPDRAWTADDMARAASALESLVAARGAASLPRFQSDRSGEVFERLTSTGNVLSLSDRSVPIHQRMPIALQHYEAVKKVFKIYVTAFMNKAVADSDTVEVMGSMFRVAVVLQDGMEEFTATLDPGDASYSVRMQGLEKWKVGMAGMITGGLMTLGERSFYGTEALTRLAGYMLETTPTLVRGLGPEARSAIVVRVKALRDDPAARELQSSMVPLYEKLRALEGQPSP